MNRTGAWPVLARVAALVIVSCAFVAACGAAVQHEAPTGTILSSDPDRPDLDSSYLFYLHGRIVEEQGERPTHPRFGVYEYPAILERLAERGLVVISEHRPAGTDAGEYARTVATQVRRLLGAGVPPSRITVVGFSKGGAIAILTASELATDQVRFVFLAACGPWMERAPDLEVHGHVLSLFEASDEIGRSCAGPLEGHPAQLTEIRLELGGGHGAFYRPQAQWLDPVITWATSGDVQL